MFDSIPAEPGSLADTDDASVVAAIEEWARLEAAASARRLSAIAELVTRRTATGERMRWACDDWDAAAAEISAALGVGHGAASRQMDLALTLRDRLPRVAAQFLDGRINSRLVAVIAARTHLVQDEEALALIDLALAERAIAWGPLSVYKLEQAIDLRVEQYDPAAVRRSRTEARARDVTIGSDDDQSGVTSIWGRLFSTDAALLDRRLAQLARTVCDDDPRTLGERRADAMGALAAGADHLQCRCDNPDCAGAAVDDGRASSIVINVMVDQDGLTATPDPAASHAESRRPITKDMPLSEALAPDEEPEVERKKRHAALIVGGGVIPTSLLAEIIARGAKVKPVITPCDASPEPRYIPSSKTRDFVRTRDITCRFPGCDRRAEVCDVDHGAPYPAGSTHPSNLRCLCRKHHLLKTFWTGRNGWSDQQLADGTVVWTAPTGRTYTTRPGSRLFFPNWDVSTGDPPPRRTNTSGPNRGLEMPKRTRTRARARASRIESERAQNTAYLSALVDREVPPPF